MAILRAYSGSFRQDVIALVSENETLRDVDGGSSHQKCERDYGLGEVKRWEKCDSRNWSGP